MLEYEDGDVKLPYNTPYVIRQGQKEDKTAFINVKIMLKIYNIQVKTYQISGRVCFFVLFVNL